MMRHHLKTEYRQYKGDEDMAYITVNNKNNTSNKTPPIEYSSWLDFWEENKGKKAERCEVRYCNNFAQVGGHVIKAGEGPKEYILPLCKACNNKPDGETFEAWESDLISVK